MLHLLLHCVIQSPHTSFIHDTIIQSTMTSKNSIVFTCPRCKTGQFSSQRALSVHLNSDKCKNLSLWSDTTNKRKHYSIPPSTAQLANSILKNMSKRHDSGLTPNHHSLLVHPTMSQLSSWVNVMNNNLCLHQMILILTIVIISTIIMINSHKTLLR